MNDAPYTWPDEDPFSIQPLLSPSPSRPTSMLNQWAEEKYLHQSVPIDDASLSSALLARSVSELLSHPTTSCQDPADLHSNDSVSLIGYDLLDDLDIPPAIHEDNTATITPRRYHKLWRTSKLSQTSQSIRNLAHAFRSPPVSLETFRPDMRGSKAANRASLPHSPSPVNTVASRQHDRSCSVGSVRALPRSTKWIPSVLPHVAPPPLHRQMSSSSNPPRPSTSSRETSSSATNTTNVEAALLSKPSWMRSIGTRTISAVSLSKFGKSSAALCLPENVPADPQPVVLPTTPYPHSLASKPLPPPPVNNEEEDEMGDEVEVLTSKPKRPTVAYSSRRSHVSLSSLTMRKKRRRLVVSGIKHDDNLRFEGVKHWCEGFGEVNKITRMPNGDLHVDFRRADVAETVCRLRAKVFISGVGSLQLSWIAGDHR